MILPTMTDNEKCFEGFRVSAILAQLHKENFHIVQEKFQRATKFPYVERMQWTDDRANNWIFWYILPSKEAKRKGKFGYFCYTTYDVPRKKGKDGFSGNNAGKGLLLFDPVKMSNKVLLENNAAFFDIVPHAINQFTERFLKPKGKLPMTFNCKVDSLLSRIQHFDVIDNISSEKHRDKGFAPHNIYMRGGGILMGQYVNEILIRMFTYVSQDMLKPEQLERQKKMISEYWHWKMEGIYF